MKNYKKIIHDGEVVVIFEPTIGAIPLDPANSDYQAYLARLEGKEPNLPEITETSEAE